MTNRFLKKIFSVWILFTFIVIGKIRLDFRNSIVFHAEDEIEIDFDTEIGNNYFKTNFDVYEFSTLQISEYLKWNNENSCKDYLDFGGYLQGAFKVCLRMYVLC